jgi:hypothetical protein
VESGSALYFSVADKWVSWWHGLLIRKNAETEDCPWLKELKLPQDLENYVLNPPD